MQADVQLVQQGAALGVEDAQQQLVILLLQARAMHQAKETRLFVNAGRVAPPTLAVVIEPAPAWQVGAQERAQRGVGGLQLHEVAAQHRAQRGKGEGRVGDHHPATMAVPAAQDHSKACRKPDRSPQGLIRFRHKAIRAGHFR